MVSGRVDRSLLDPGAARALWNTAVNAPSWQGEGVWPHRDLYVDNLLARGGRLSEVVDFGGLVVGDPAGNVMAAWHVLPAAHRPTFLRIVGASEAPGRSGTRGSDADHRRDFDPTDSHHEPGLARIITLGDPRLPAGRGWGTSRRVGGGGRGDGPRTQLLLGRPDRPCTRGD
jgi:hypothetical protein